MDEQPLHKAIVSAINEFCEVKDDVANQSDHAIILKGNMVLFSHAVLDYTAKKCGTTSMTLKSILIDNGVLQRNLD